MSAEPSSVDSAKGAIGLKAYLASLAAQVSSVPETWIRAELHSLQVTAKYVRYEFVEHGPDGSLVARAAGGCRPSVHRRIAMAFEHAGLELRAGGMVLAAVRAHLEPAYGLQVEVLDIDIRFSQGDLGQRIDRIRDRLRREDCWSMNRDLHRPADFVHVVVISPAGAAGLGDFQTGVRGLRRHRLTAFTYHEAPFQTAEAPPRITAILRSLHEEAAAGRLCAVAIIRGGGAASDLTWLVDYDLVKAVCCMPVPVLVGIGHQRDRSLLDEVANLSCSTPTAVANHILSTVCLVAIAAGDSVRDVKGQSASILGRLAVDCRETTAHAYGGARAAICEPATLVTRRANLRPGAIASLADAERKISAAAADARSNSRVSRRVASAQVASAVEESRIQARAALRGAYTAVVACALGHAPSMALRDAHRATSATAATVAAAVTSGLRRPDAGIATARNAIEASCLSAHAAAVAALATTAMTVAAHGRVMIGSAAATVEHSAAVVTSASTENVLAAGYALLRNEMGKPIMGIAGLRSTRKIAAVLRDGTAYLTPFSRGVDE